jgi:hypothetical protein
MEIRTQRLHLRTVDATFAPQVLAYFCRNREFRLIDLEVDDGNARAFCRRLLGFERV